MNSPLPTHAKTHLKSLWEFLNALKDIGEVQTIDKEVARNLETGAAAIDGSALAVPLFNRQKASMSAFARSAHRTA
jgi:3-polyprenyl-4-hydroxybenzoate decarboxylase